MTPSSSIQKARRRLIITSWTGAMFLFGCVLLLNYIVSYVPLRLDTSQGRIYSISKGTKNLLKKIDDTMLFRLVFSSNLPPQLKLNEQYIRDLVAEYQQAAGGKIKIEYLDPGSSDKARMDAVQTGVTPVQVDIRKKDRREVQESFMGLSLIYGDKSETIAFIQDSSGLEYEITSRIKKLVSPGQNKIGIVGGNSALTLSSEPLKAMEAPLREQFTILDVNLKTGIPGDIKSLWLFGPASRLEEVEIQNLRSWVAQGGTLGIFFDRYDIPVEQFTARSLDTGLEGLFREWGINTKPALVADLRCDRIQVQTIRGYYRVINVIDYAFFPLSSDLNREQAVIKDIDAVSMPFVTPLFIENAKPGFTYTPLVLSSPYSWLVMNPRSLSPLERYTKPDAAEAGPFNLGLVIEIPASSTSTASSTSKGKVILFGTSKFIRTDLPPRPQNFSLFMNLLDWSVQDEALLAIRSKGAAMRPLKRMPDALRIAMKYVLMGTLPLFSILLGVFIWRRQKIKRALLPLVYREG